MPTAEEFIETNFTAKGLVLEGLPIGSAGNRISVKKISNSSEVAYLRYMVTSDKIEIVQITRINKNTNATYKGIGKALLVVLAIEAYKHNKRNITLFAVPGAKDAMAMKLFNYYHSLGGIHDSIIHRNETGWTQSFKFSVEKLLDNNDIVYPEQIPLIHVEDGDDYVYSNNSNNNGNNNGGGSRKTRKTKKTKKPRKNRHTRIRRRA
jgi:hypothetical protein